MLLDIIWNNETTQVDLADAKVTVGGGSEDDIKIAGLPWGLIQLTIDAAKVVVTSTRSVQIGAALFPARVPRLLGEGEELQLPNEVVLRRPADLKRLQSRKLVGTAFVAKELLSAMDLAPGETRAASLTCVTGLDRGRTFPIAFERSVIGRADDADVRVRDRTVSRQHAHLVHKSKTYALRALSTTNGIFVNGIRVKGEKELKTGDIIELGQTMLRFEGPERAPEEVTNVKPKDAAPPSAAPAPASAPAPVAAQAAAKASGPAIDLEVAASAITEALPERPRRQLPFEVVVMSLGVVMALVGIGVTLLMLR